MKYEYRGPAPVADEAGELIRPLDVREFSTPPDCPPWLPLEEPQAEAPPPPPAETETPAPARTAKGGK